MINRGKIAFTESEKNPEQKDNTEQEEEKWAKWIEISREVGFEQDRAREMEEIEREGAQRMETNSVPSSSFASNLNLDGNASSSDDDSVDFEPPKKRKKRIPALESESDDEACEPTVEKTSSSRQWKRIHVESDSDDSSEKQEGDKNNLTKNLQDDLSESEEDSNNAEDEKDESYSSDEQGGPPEFRIMPDEEGHNHVSYPDTGKFYDFLKSHNFKPSTIERHINDIINIFEANEVLKEKKVLSIIVDDGADYGIRSPSTLHLFGRLWLKLDLDMLMIVKNAPKYSKHNPVEHGWGFLTPKLAGLVLPTKLEDDIDETEEIEEEMKESEEKNPDVADQGIGIVKGALKLDGFDVVPVGVFCDSDDVEIEGQPKRLFGDEELVRTFYDSSLSKERLRKRDPEMLKEAKLFNNHVDKRSHSIFFRKWHMKKGDRPCKHCRIHPPRASSSLWKDLPRRESGGLLTLLRS